MAEFSWSYGRGRFFWSLRFAVISVVFFISGKRPKYLLGVYWVILFFLGVVRVVSIFGSNMPKTTSDLSHLTDIFSGHCG